MTAVALNDALDWAQIRHDYQTDRRLRITNFLQADSAQSLYACLEKQEYSLAMTFQGRPFEASKQQWAQLPENERQAVMQDIQDKARQGFGFVYERLKVDGQRQVAEPIQNAFALMNSEAMLEHMREVTGHTDIKHASMQVTAYTPGCFLTRHNDLHDSEGRRVAYVINMAQNWHSDWGGLLQFYQQDGTPRDAWSPLFNSLSLFDVRHVHAVTYVAPYAGSVRYALTGWFRAN